MKKRKYKGSIYLGIKRKKKSRVKPILESAFIRKICILTIFMCILIVFFFGSKRYVSAQPNFKTNLQKLDLSGGEIYWAKGKARNLVLKSLENSIKCNLPIESDTSLVDSNIVKHVYDAIVCSPWINEIWEVKRVFPDKISARFDVRKPEIAVMTGDFIVTLDSNGIILPLIFSDRIFREFNEYLFEKLKIVVGLDAEIVDMQDFGITIHTFNDEFLSCGEVWNDARIFAALAVNNSLKNIKNYPEFKSLKFNAINVENVGGKASLLASDIIINAEIVKSQGRKKRKIFSIWWGRDEEHAGFGENSVDEKFEMLRNIITLNPMLSDISKIDLRFPNAELAPVYKHD
ncbi:MAG: hypothetical protein K8S87_03530 [Planctomycetes bacterium]|nr:hypothetical protein [Planctomycetota bacterium]